MLYQWMQTQPVELHQTPIDEFIRKYRVYDFQMHRSDFGWQTGLRDSRISMEMDERDFFGLVRVERRASELMDRERQEEKVRAECPAVKTAWEQYCMLLELCK